MRRKIENEFIEILNSYAKQIYKFCWTFSDGSEDGIKDLQQQVAIRLLECYRKDKQKLYEAKYIYRIIQNTLVDNYRKEKRIKKIFERLTQKHDIEDEQKPVSKAKELHELINMLDPCDKMLINLYLDKYSYKEIAEIMEITESNVGTRMSRIKEKLKKLKEKKYGKDY